MSLAQTMQIFCLHMPVCDEFCCRLHSFLPNASEKALKLSWGESLTFRGFPWLNKLSLPTRHEEIATRDLLRKSIKMVCRPYEFIDVL